MSTEKENSAKESKRPKGKVIRPLFETKEHKREEKEYEEYYNRIRHMSRGRV